MKKFWNNSNEFYAEANLIEAIQDCHQALRSYSKLLIHFEWFVENGISMLDYESGERDKMWKKSLCERIKKIVKIIDYINNSFESEEIELSNYRHRCFFNEEELTDHFSGWLPA